MLEKILNFFSKKDEEETVIILKYTDCVETGYLCEASKSLGGTIDISVEYAVKPTKFDLTYGLDKLTLDAIDTLDHATIADDSDISDFSERYFIINGKCQFEVDAGLIIYNIISKGLQAYKPALKDTIKSITVKFNKTEVILDQALLKSNSNILIDSYIIQGDETC